MDVAAALNLLRTERRGDNRTGDQSGILPHITRTTWDDAWHAVEYSDLNEQNADAVIAEQISHFRARNVEFEWKLFADDKPADLRDRLVRHGFEVGPREAVVLYDLVDGLDAFEQPTACIVNRITEPGQVDVFRKLAETVFNKNYAGTTAELKAGLAAGSTNHLGYIGTVDGEPACVGRLYTSPASALGGLYGGGTLEKFRGLGCYRAMVAARARAAAALGARYILVDALPTSLPILLRLGFTHVTDTWPCVWLPPQKP